MSVGWVDLIVDGKPAQGRICYVMAWNDPEWRKANKLPPRDPSTRGGPKPKERR